MSTDTNSPFFSVCLPTYNYARYIGDAIRSVLRQDFQDFEVVICDDCSDDDTESVVRGFGDPRISYHRNSERLGIFGNMNAAMRRSRGRYLKTLCADDMLSPACLGVVHRNIMAAAPAARPNVVLIRSTLAPGELAERVDGLGPSRAWMPEQVMGMVSRRETFYPNLPSFCVDREYFAARGYFQTRGRDRDYALDMIDSVRLLASGPSLLLDAPLVLTRQHGKNAGVRLSRLIALEEILAFARDPSEAIARLPDAKKAMSTLAERAVLSEARYALRALFRGNVGYLGRVVRITREQGYGTVPWGMVVRESAQSMVGRVTGRRRGAA
jgi:glycosyltransferase involved in cell wall biosynthesis